jgi:hypothetical protein
VHPLIRHRVTIFFVREDFARAVAATDRVSALMLKLLVVLNTRQTLVEYGTCVRPQRFKHGRVKQHELWSPNLIGWRYQPAQSVEPQGTHASPRPHWRRGHVRNQPCGSGRSQRKLIWIEPMLVGMSEREETSTVGSSEPAGSAGAARKTVPLTR